MKQPAIIIGMGGHASVVYDCLRRLRAEVLGAVAPQAARADLIPGLTWLGDDEQLAAHNPAAVELVNGLGSTADTRLRSELYQRLTGQGYRFRDLIHPSAVCSDSARHDAGLQLLAGAVIGPHARLGANVLINSRAVIEHHCRIDDHSHVAPGAVVCGQCEIGRGVHIGAGATLIQGISIGDGAIIAAGAVVTRNVEPLTRVAGIPARAL